MSPGTDSPTTPGEVLRNWQQGACEWLQSLTRTAQQLRDNGINESARFVEHMQRQHTHRHARASRHGALASLSASLPAAQPRQRPRSRVRFSGKGMNCIVSDLADGAAPGLSQKGHAATDSSKPNSEELQERILVSEVITPLQTRSVQSSLQRRLVQILMITLLAQTLGIKVSGSVVQIEVTGIEGPLKEAAEQVLTMKPNFSYTLQEVSDDCGHIFDLGWFAKCAPHAEDTRDGIKLTIKVLLSRSCSKQVCMHVRASCMQSVLHITPYRLKILEVASYQDVGVHHFMGRCGPETSRNFASC